MPDARLGELAALIRKWSPAINLVSPADLPHLEARHIADSAQLARDAPSTGRWVDLGSGGGLPGLVVAILFADRDMNVELVESDQRKAAFLRRAASALALSRVVVHAVRAEALDPRVADIVSARALAPLPKLLPWVHRHLSPGGEARLMKGASWRSEVEAARASWHFDLETQPSATSEGARILHVCNLVPAPDHRHREPEGRGREDHDGREPRGRPRAGGA